MNNEGLLFVGILIFMFIVWSVTGGPTRPISFAGPYITPLTNVIGVQGGSATSISSGGSNTSYTSAPASTGDVANYQQQVADLQRKVNQSNLFGSPSSYHGQVSLSGSAISATDPAQQYVTLYYSGGSGTSVTISGWQLTSIATDKSATIPLGDPLPSNASASARSPIVLYPGDQAIIITGHSPLGASFKENECSGYQAHTATFYPSLSQSCPNPRDEFDRFYTGNKFKDSGCYDLMSSTNTCQIPPERSNLSSSCYAFISDHLSYSGCVATHQSDTTFTGRVWHIYLNYREPNAKRYQDGNSLLWRASHEAIKLTDSTGKTVDLYASY